MKMKENGNKKQFTNISWQNIKWIFSSSLEDEQEKKTTIPEMWKYDEDIKNIIQLQWLMASFLLTLHST